MMWLVGSFKPKIDPNALAVGDPRPVGAARVLVLTPVTLPRTETAVGTIQPVHRVEVASRILARALEVNVTAGQSVAKGDILARLEDTDLKSRLSQAQSAVSQAQAALDLARIEESRMRNAFEKNGVAAIDLDRAVNALKGAEAALSRAKQAEDETKTIMDYAIIRSPIDGTVVDKRINSGDTVSPGQVVVTVLDPTRMQLVASVRESLSHRLTVGGTVSVKVDIMDEACDGTVSEIVPEALGASRSFQVKVTGPCPEGVYAGMFGRLIIPVASEDVLLVPRNAVQTIGQVDCVDVAINNTRVRRAVRIGREIDGQLEIISGLAPGESIVIDDAKPNPAEVANP
jgi:RND family efflux transporter MFP subunit